MKRNNPEGYNAIEQHANEHQQAMQQPPNAQAGPGAENPEGANNEPAPPQLENGSQPANVVPFVASPGGQ
jgi:hypothetical protein